MKGAVKREAAQGVEAVLTDDGEMLGILRRVRLAATGSCAPDGGPVSPEQREAIRSRDVLRLVQLGGNIYYLAKFAGIFGLSVQDVGAQQRGMRVDEFKHMLEQSGELTHG